MSAFPPEAPARQLAGGDAPLAEASGLKEGFAQSRFPKTEKLIT